MYEEYRMRVIAGAWRGMKLKAPEGQTTRPTSDRVKESLYNIISNKIGIEGITVLDICAGTGSLGIEALSRGADSCCFIEQDRKVVEILKNNLSAVRLENRAELLVLEALKGLQMLAGRKRSFDLVFFDPPYDSALYDSVPAFLSSAGLLAAGSLFVAECSRRTTLPESFGPLLKTDRRVYGDTALEFFSLGET